MKFPSMESPPNWAEKGKPHGWIQWKGTDACIDLYCECGAHMHTDEAFLYSFKCGHCGKRWELSSYIKLMELDSENPEHDRTHESVLMDDHTVPQENLR